MITEISTEPARPGGDVGVIVHASRTTTGVRVHEETRAVTLLPDGAVVRLKARVPVGDLVVLTHAQTKAHVICRVKNAKPPADVPDGVVLEFIQPAPGFWSDAAAGEKSESAPKADLRPAEVSGDAARAPQNQQVMLPVSEGSVEETVRPRERAVRTPVWRQRTEVRERGPVQGGLAARPAIGVQAGLALENVRPTRAVQSIEIAHAGVLTADVSELRTSNTKMGAMVLVAVISIANGTLLGAWVYKQMAGANTGTQQTTQQSGAGVRPGKLVADVSGPARAAGGALATPVSLRTSPGAPVESARDAAAGALARRVDDEHASTGLSDERGTENRDATQDLEDAPALPSTFVGEMQPPRAPRVLVVPAANAPVAMDEGRGLTQAGTAVRLLTGAGALTSPAPPVGGRLVPARLISSPPPVYPPAARALRIRGGVTLDAVVDETGKVSETTVVEGNPLLQEAAQDALRNWKYEPARLNGSAISTHIRVSLQFGLN